MKWLVLAGIRFYKKFLWPIFPSQCRFQPTCSEYAYRQIERHGILRGTAAAISRLLSCHG